MGTSGLLAQDTNTFNGVVIKYNEPQDAKIPNIRYGTRVDTVALSNPSCFVQ